MKNLIQLLFPKIIYASLREKFRYLRLLEAYRYDLNHYFKYSMSNNKGISKSKAISKIILDTHVIEKGLTMPKTKLGFGSVRLEELMKSINEYVLIFGKNNPQLLHGISVVNEYFSFHKDENFNINKKLVDIHNELLEIVKINTDYFEINNQISMTKDSYFKYSENSFINFSNSRSSIRNFSQEPIDKNLIYSALDLCRNTPSACNRQSVRVHLYTDKEQIKEILDLQGGNRGFGHLTSNLLIVTFEPSVYFEESERYSGYVDGGMYCMNILYSLHANKIAGCILNTAHHAKKDIAIRKYTKISDSESFVAMIACGIPPENFKIAKSLRYPLDYILIEH